MKDRWVLAVAGTHGKTTTSSMLAWILQYAGMEPGFLIGGVPGNFGLSARFGNQPFFVVEADEYDTAFFDKRSKFVHYRPRTAILNNLEFDHADIFENLDAIKKQFHHLVRTVPGRGLLVVNGADKNLDDVLAQGCWSQRENFSLDGEQWSIANCAEDGKTFDVHLEGKFEASVSWDMNGAHNRMNALAAIAAARHAGVPTQHGCAAMAEFKGIKRRMEIRGVVRGVTVYDDFAHHPTAIEETLAAMQEVANGGRVLAVLEPRSNTMRMGVHQDSLSQSLQAADDIYLYQPTGMDWGLHEVAEKSEKTARVFEQVEKIIQQLCIDAKEGDQIIIMSNGSFESIHTKLLTALEK